MGTGMVGAPKPVPPDDFRFDVFISYSRKDIEFARRLERELRRYRPPKDLGVPQRRLRAFRDEEDFTGPDYHASLDRSLKDAAKLIVICSPNSAASRYVAEEIDRFSRHRGPEHIIPLLLDGVPNNELRDDDVARKAFPDQLVRLLPTPLAADYRGFDPRGDKVHKGAFAPAWFKTLADVYAAYGVDRAMVEQRERRRRARTLRNAVAIGGTVALVVVGLTMWALQQRANTEARRAEAQARVVFDGSGDGLVKATLLSVASVRFAPTIDGHISLVRFAQLLPRVPLWRQARAEAADGTPRRRVLAVSPDGSRIAEADILGPVQLLDARTGRPVGSIELGRTTAAQTVIAFSPDGAFLVVGCGHQACVVDVPGGRLLTRLPSAEERHGEMVWSASFSPDGKSLAMAAYGSNETRIYDVRTWRTIATLRHGAGWVFSVAFSPNGEWLATADNSLQLWRVGRYDAPVAQADVRDIVWSIAFHPDGSGLWTAGGQLQSWAIASGDGARAELKVAASTEIRAHTVVPISIRTEVCVAAAASDAVHLLCGASLNEVARIPVSSAAVAVNAHAHQLLNAQSDGTLAAFPLEPGLDVVRFRAGTPIRSIAVAEHQGWLAAGTADGDVFVVGLDTWQEKARLRVLGPVADVSVSSDGRWLAVAAGRTVRVFDAGNWRAVASATDTADVAWARFDASGRWLVIASGKMVAAMGSGDWHVQLRVERGASSDLESVRASPDGSKLAVVSRWMPGHDSGVHLTQIFDLASARETGWEYSAGGGDISERFMREEAARVGRELRGGDTRSVEASASAWRVLKPSDSKWGSSADDVWRATEWSSSVIALVDASTSREIGRLDHGSEVTTVQFVPAVRSRWLVSGGEDGTLAIWPIRAEDLADEGCIRLRGILSANALATLIAAAQARRSCEAT